MVKCQLAHIPYLAQITCLFIAHLFIPTLVPDAFNTVFLYFQCSLKYQRVPFFLGIEPFQNLIFSETWILFLRN